jgi:class 3 adenylate cyclase
MRFEATGHFAVPPENLWPYLSDTQRLNRVVGLPQIVFKTEPLATGGSRVTGEYPIGSAVVSLLCQVFPLDPTLASDAELLRWLPKWPVARWVEHPFEWQANRLYAVSRDYFWTPLGLYPFRLFRGGAELRPTEGGCEVTAFADITPSNPQGALLTRTLLGPKAARGVIRQCQLFEKFVLGSARSPFPQLERGEPTGAPAATARDMPAAGSQVGTASEGWDGLLRAGVKPGLVARLRDHVEHAADEDVLEMRPFALADRWGTDRRETLVLFLHATTAGLVEMSWKVLCPNCRISKAGFSSLADIKEQAHCETCNITFDAMVDRQVEVRFTVNERIRHVEDRRFCAGGPQNVPHVMAQAELAPGETRTIHVELPAAAYRLRSLQCATNAVVETASPNGAVATTPTAGPDGEPVDFRLTPDAILPPLVGAPAGGVTMRVTNETGVAATLVVERPDWPDDAATAALVGTLQEFRDLFGKEALAPGLQLVIQRIAFLFTDLTGSTALYQAIGQARAFRLVQDHFTILLEVIAAHNGALVKTIGDAVMATFPTGIDAFRAAIVMQREIDRLDVGDVRDAVDLGRFLKIGVHEGPCIAVGANERLDYFGTTINVAARVQSEAHGGEVVVTTEIFELPAVQDALRQDGLTATQSEARLRGVREPVRLYRIGPLTGAAPPRIPLTSSTQAVPT